MSRIVEIDEVTVARRIMAITAAFFMLIGGLLGGWLWPYTIESWATFFGNPVDVKVWQGILLGVIPYFGGLTVPLAIATWMFMLIFGGGGG